MRINMVIVNIIRKYGWPDSHGVIQYGNAAILCYLSMLAGSIRLDSIDERTKALANEFIEKYKDMPAKDLIAKYA